MQIDKIRHSLAHITAYAVCEIFGKVQLGIGPVIENGFYYDIDFKGKKKLTLADLPKIEKRMKELIGQDIKFKKKMASKAEARKIFKNQPYKLELIKEISEKQAGLYESGDFTDLCRGPHVKSTKEINPDAFKLTKVAGAYWRGSEKNPMLTRIYGVAFDTKRELGEYLQLQAEAEKRDHRKLGRLLGLFTFSELVGPGLPLFTPKGTILRNVLISFIEDLERSYGFQQVWIPHLAKPDLYRVSGHLEKFKDDIFYVKGKETELILKPMNCPHHIQLYKTETRSYKDLPIRYFETSTVYRDEKLGELSGLTRVRSVTQDDGHVFLREDQIAQEFEINLKIQKELMRTVGFGKYWIRLSLRDEKNKKAYLGDDATWKKSQTEMEKLLKKQKVNYEVKKGEAAFYGPKMDFLVQDSLGREWQLSTIQLDLNLPRRFQLEYTAENGTKKTPVIIHRAFMGAVERFIAIIIEHFDGNFPLWLAPEQIWIVPVSRKFNTFANKIEKELREKGNGQLRLSLKDENETLGKKIRGGQIQKIPYLLIVGEKEKKTNSVSLRERKKGDIGMIKLDKFIERVKREIESKK